MSDPLVSILVPTYNGERFLQHTLRSALTQSYRSIEVLVGDDGSTDRTPELLAAVAATDPRVRVIRHEQNVGAFENPRLLLREAAGDYVKFLLHDDLLSSDCVRVLVRGLQADPGATLAFSRRRLVDERGQPVPGPGFPKLRDRPGTIGGRLLGDTVLRTCTNVIGELTTVLFRRDVVDPDTLWEADGRPLAVLGDALLWLRLLAEGDAFYTPEVLSSFRQHAAQNSRNQQVVAPAVRDWPLLIDWARRHGFLADEADEREAHALVLRSAAHFHAELAHAPEGAYPLEALYLSLARLLELRAGDPGAGAPLPDRAHGSRARARLAQEVDAWTVPRPLAVAAPSLDPLEVAATVTALREVRAAGAAERLVVTAPRSSLDALVPLLEVALSGGPDIDVDVVGTDDPAELPEGPWLAVAPRGSTWHHRAVRPAWLFDVPAHDHAAAPGR